MANLRRIRLAFITLFLTLICGSGAAATRVWINPAGGNWNVAANWDTGVPQAGDDVVISGTGAFTVTLDIAATVNSLTLGDSVPDGIQSLTLPLSALTITGASVVHPDGRINWNAGTLGGTGTLEISSGGQLVIGGGTSAKSLAGLDINNGGTVQWLATTINCTSTALFQNLAGATFNAAGFNFNGETCRFTNAGTFVKSGAGTITFTATFQNDSTVEVQAGTLALSEAGTHDGSFTVAAGSVLQFGGGSNLQTLNSPSSVTGAGTLRFSAGTTNVAGTVNITGATDFAGGGQANLTGTITSLGNSVVLSNGTANLNAGGTLVIPNALTLSNGTLAGSTAVTVNGPTTWNGGGLSGTGKLTVNGGMAIGGTSNKTWINKVIDNPGTTTWNATNLNTGQGARFNNLATGLLSIRGNVVMTMSQGGSSLIDNQGGVRRSVGTGVAAFDVPFQGPGVVEVLTGTLEFRENSTHDGDLTVASGAILYLSSGTHSINAGTSVTGAGTFRVGGTVNLPGTIDITGRTWLSTGALNVTGTLTSLGNSVQMDNGTLNLTTGGTLIIPDTLFLGAGTLTGTTSVTVNGHTTWWAATLSVTGKLTVNGGMTIASASSKTWILTEIDNPGITNYYGWNLLTGQGARFNNLPGGTFNVRGDASIFVNQGGTALFNNEGTLRRLESAGVAGLDVPFQSTGLVEVQTGTLSFGSNGTFEDLTVAAGSTLMFETGTHTIAAGASVSGAGTLRVHLSTVNIPGEINITGRTWLSAGTLNLTGTLTSLGNSLEIDSGTANLAVGGTYTIPTLILDGGVLTGNTSLTVTGHTTWNHTTLQIDGKLTPSGGMTIGGSGSRIWIKTIIDNPGTTTWFGWHMNMGQGARFNNLPSGTFDIRTDATMFLNQGGTATFNNEGMVRRSAGAGQAMFGVPFESPGSVEVQTGTLLFNGEPATFGGDVTIGTGTTLMFSGGTGYVMNSASTLSGAGTLRVHFTGTLSIAGTVDISGRTWVSGGTLNITGTLNSLGEDVEIGGSSLVNLAAGGTLTIPDSLILGGGTLTGSTSVIVNGPTTWNNNTLRLTGKLTVNGGLTILDNANTWLFTEIENPAITTWSTSNNLNHINAGQGARFTNLATGTFNVLTAADILFNQGGADPQFHNAGIFRKTAGTANATSLAAQFFNTGTVEATLGTLSFVSGYTQTAGVTRLNGGGLVVTGSPGLDVQAGILTGIGTITGNVRNAGALNAGQSPGRLHITGTYTQTENGFLNAEFSGLIAGTEHDQVTIGGAATLGGTLNAANIDLYEPNDGDAFTVMTYASATGDFETKNLDFGPGRSFTTTKNATNYILTALIVEADVAVIKSGPASAPATEPIVYNLSVSNAGPDPSDGIVVTDPLDPNVTFVGANTSGFWSCSYLPADHDVVCTATGALGIGAAENIVITVNPPANGSVSNSASLTSETHDPNAANNSSGPVITNVDPVANLNITKSDSPDPVEANAAFQYTISVGNAGPSVASPVTVSDTLPAGVQHVFSGGTGWTCSFSDPVITCTMESLAVGTAPDITIEVLAPSQGGTITNSATVSSPADSTPATATETTLVLAADLAITKSAPASVAAGADFTYTITVQNLGPSDATSITVSDPLDPNVTFVSANATGFWSCGHSAQTVTCTSTAALTPGMAPEIMIQVTAPSEPMPLSNTASITASSPPDPEAANNSSGPISTSVTAEADLSIAKSASAEPVAAGQLFTYSIHVSNAGPSVATTVVVTDPLDSRLTFVSAGGDGWSCGFSVGTVGCERIDLAVGPAEVIEIVVRAAAEAAVISNAASVSAAAEDPNPADNSAAISSTISALVDVSVTKEDDPDPVIFGTALTYTITVQNAGPSTATGVVMNDVLPSEVSFFSASTSQGACTESAGTVHCEIGSVAAGASATITIVVNPNAIGVISNTATIQSTETDSNTDNNSATQATTIGQLTADLSITKLDTPDPVTAGAELTYTLEVSNAGPDAAASVLVTDTLPGGVGLVSAGGTGWSCSGSSIVVCTLPVLAGGSTASLVIVVTAPTPGTIVNTATVESSTNDPNPDNNSAEQTTVVLHGDADLILDKSVNPERVTEGAELTYTLRIGNAGPAQATGVTVQDNLPADVDLLSVDPSAGTCTGASTIVCDIGTLPVGSDAEVAIRVRTRNAGTLINTASVSADQNDPSASNNSDSVSTIVDAEGDISISKSGPASVSPGSVVTYQIRVLNSGSAGVSAIMVRDHFPKQLGDVQWICSPTPGSSCSRTSGSHNLNVHVDLAAHGEVLFTVNATVAPGATGSITNTATMKLPHDVNDPVPENNSSSTTAVVAP